MDTAGTMVTTQSPDRDQARSTRRDRRRDRDTARDTTQVRRVLAIIIQDFHLQKSLLNPADSSGRMSRRKSETVIQVPGGKEGRREERREARTRARRLSDPSQVETVASSLNSLTLGEKTLTCRHHQDGNAGKSVS